MKTTIAAVCFAMAAMVAAPVFAESQPTPSRQITKEEAQAAIEKVKADKKYLTTQEMKLTDAEAAAFWPLYDEYQEGLQNVNKRIGVMLAEYAELYRNNTMTDAKAAKLLAEMVAIESDELALKKTMIPKLQKALPGIKVTRYIQIENKLRALVKIQLGDKIPLIK